MLQKSATIPSERTRHQNGNSKEPSRAGLLHAKRMPCEQNFNRLSSKSQENAAAPKLHDEKDKAQYARRSRTTSNHLADAKAELADVRQNELT